MEKCNYEYLYVFIQPCPPYEYDDVPYFDPVDSVCLERDASSGVEIDGCKSPRGEALLLLASAPIVV